jgi:RNA polymerase sigma-70 factor (ECF subfamily)
MVSVQAADRHMTEATTSLGGFDEFWRLNRRDLARALAVTLGDPDLASDAADEAMARAYQHWDRVGSYANPAGWAYRVGLNWSRSVLRRRRRFHPTLYRRDTVEPPTVIDPAVHRALAGLDIKHRSVIVCRFLLDWSVEETATALDLRPGTVKSRLSRALDRLRAELHHLEPEVNFDHPHLEESS